MPRQQWLADVARSAGLAVVEVDGWRERGNPALNPGGVCEHHTAGGRNGDIPSLRVLIEGRSDLPGPLCNYGIARSGTIYVIAAGRANHAGPGGWQGMVGNSSVIGVEYENAGGAGDPWPQVQLEAGARLSAAVMTHLGRETKYVCFPAEVLILTRRGLISIAEVRVGDEVWTHRNRWQPVTKTGKRMADTLRLRGLGHPGLVVTREHPFYSPDESRRRVEGRPGHNYRTFGDFTWVPAEKMAGRCWASPLFFGDDSDDVPFSVEQSWLVGHWLAEGFSVKAEARHACHQDEATTVAERARAAGYKVRWGAVANMTAVVAVKCGREHNAWLKDEFGYMAYGKHLPAWVFTMPEKHRAALLDGYLFGDGWAKPNGGYEARSVSKHLAIGMKLLAQSLGWATALYRRAGGPSSIQGRSVQTREQWILRLRPFASSRSQLAKVEDWFVGRVRTVETGPEREVFNITVAEDESYVADGIVVHNCEHKEWAPSRKVDRHSIAGGQWRQRVQQLMDGGDEGKGDNVIYEFLTPDEPERFIGIARAGEVVLFADFGDSSVRLATGVAGDFVVETITVPHGKHVRRTIRSASGGPAHGISVRLEAGQRCGVTVYQ